MVPDRMMFTCLGRGGPPTLPHGVNGDFSQLDSEKFESLRSVTLERTTHCGPPLQTFINHNVSQSFWKGFGDIKEILNPCNLNMQTSTFYVEDERDVRNLLNLFMSVFPLTAIPIGRLDSSSQSDILKTVWFIK